MSSAKCQVPKTKRDPPLATRCPSKIPIHLGHPHQASDNKKRPERNPGRTMFFHASRATLYAFIRAPSSSTVKIQAAIFPAGIVAKPSQ